VSDSFYQSTDDKQTFGLRKGFTAATDMWCIIHGILMHTVSTYFIGIILVSVSGMIQHKRISEGIIDDTGLAASAQSSTETTPSGHKNFSTDKYALFINMQQILHFFSNFYKLQEVTST
jgi:hypothetical protein